MKAFHVICKILKSILFHVTLWHTNRDARFVEREEMDGKRRKYRMRYFKEVREVHEQDSDGTERGGTRHDRPSS